MNIIIDVKRLIRQFVSPHRRQPVRLGWLYSLIDLQGIFDSFSLWRKNFRYKVKVTSQIFVLTHHLKKVFKTDIVIQSYVDSYITVGNEKELTHWKAFGLNSEDSVLPFPKNGENSINFDDSDFLVIAPPSVSKSQLMGEVEKYKLADKTYNIKIAEV